MLAIGIPSLLMIDHLIIFAWGLSPVGGGGALLRQYRDSDDVAAAPCPVSFIDSLSPLTRYEMSNCN